MLDHHCTLTMAERNLTYIFVAYLIVCGKGSELFCNGDDMGIDL